MRVLSGSLLVLGFLLCASSAGLARSLAPQDIDSAQPGFKSPKKESVSRAAIVKAQIMLARVHFSPGEIDGREGENFKKALTAFGEANNIPVKGKLSKELWDKLQQIAGENELTTEYEISDGDLKGPFAEKLPKKMEEMKDLPGLPYTNVVEAIAERFHISEALLRDLNPGAKFTAGERLIVPNLETDDAVKAKRLEIDTKAQTVRVYDESDALVAYYPATVGSTEKPSPSGELKVTSVSKNPTYHYNPDYNFKGVKSTKPFEIKPGPNNPVGTVWIGLSEKGYGIHGTPDPSKISKAESHGCVRLTNWDAEELSRMVGKGTPVSFQNH